MVTTMVVMTVVMTAVTVVMTAVTVDGGGSDNRRARTFACGCGGCLTIST
jgi:hypothetical protein